MPPVRRGHFDEEGADAPPDAGPKRVRATCLANGCTMPGTLFLGGDGICAWHLGCSANELPRITEVMRNWQCVTEAINAGRSFANDPARCSDVKAQTVALLSAWNRMHESVIGSGWEPTLKPVQAETYGDWTRRLEQFLSDRIKVDVNGRELGATRDSPTVRDMRARMRPAGWRAAL